MWINPDCGLKPDHGTSTYQHG
ncbi:MULTISPECIES: hypothetical protein [Pseudoalteromonas]|nr:MULTISPECIES: hypothetical protein [Pseudoalteromonas]WMS95929.1 hypothetical protein RB215_06030 [Pseudoalteromonas sp. HL-AS2]